MKETDIVQALRCCAEGECKDCAMHEDKQRCQENLLDKAAEAIERLTAENAGCGRRCRSGSAWSNGGRNRENASLLRMAYLSARRTAQARIHGEDMTE